MVQQVEKGNPGLDYLQNTVHRCEGREEGQKAVRRILNDIGIEQCTPFEPASSNAKRVSGSCGDFIM